LSNTHVISRRVARSLDLVRCLREHEHAALLALLLEAERALSEHVACCREREEAFRLVHDRILAEMHAYRGTTAYDLATELRAARRHLQALPRRRSHRPAAASE
jgi:hypothetical protein